MQSKDAVVALSRISTRREFLAATATGAAMNAGHPIKMPGSALRIFMRRSDGNPDIFPRDVIR